VTRSPDRACVGKQPHATRAAATAALHALAQNRHVNPRQLQVYRCPFCLSYHYGHRINQPKGRKS